MAIIPNRGGKWQGNYYLVRTYYVSSSMPSLLDILLDKVLAYITEVKAQKFSNLPKINKARKQKPRCDWKYHACYYSV